MKLFYLFAFSVVAEDCSEYKKSEIQDCKKVPVKEVKFNKTKF